MKKVLFIKILPIIAVLVLVQMMFVSPSAAAPPASGSDYYVVQDGDTLFSIGWLYGVNPYAIAEANGLYNPNYIYAGQVLYIPACGGGCHCGCGGGLYSGRKSFFPGVSGGGLYPGGGGGFFPGVSGGGFLGGSSHLSRGNNSGAGDTGW